VDCHRYGRTISSEAPLSWFVDDLIAPWILSPLLAYEAVALDAQTINLGQHPFGRFGRDACPLKGTDFLPLPEDLPAHMLDFIPDGVMARAAIITAVTDLYKFLPPPAKPSKPGGG
jgi:hypothetical protein